MTADKPAHVGTREPPKSTRAPGLYAASARCPLVTGSDMVSPDPGVGGFWTKDLQRIRDPGLQGKPVRIT